MRRTLCFAIIAAALPLALHAQDATLPRYLEISELAVPMDEARAFEEATTMIVDAARQAGLTAQWGWDIWQEANRYGIVSNLESLALLDDPMVWIRQFEGTPGHAPLMAAFEKTAGMHISARSSIMEIVPDWSYMPAGAPQHAWAQVLSYKPISGSDESLDALIKETVAVLGRAAWPFQVLGSRTRIGEGAIEFVILFDDPVRYETESAKLETNPAWQALGPRFATLLFDADVRRLRHRPDLSYRPGR